MARAPWLLLLAAVLVAGSATGSGVVGPGGRPAAATHAGGGSGPTAPRYRGMRCPDPVGHRITQCRLGVHGTPDLSRRAWRTLRGAEVTVSAAFRELAPNPAAEGRRDWPLVDSLGLPMGQLVQDARGKVRIDAVDGVSYAVVAMNVRGHGCAASDAQMQSFTLAQLIAPKAPSHGTQAFLPIEAVADPAVRAVHTGQAGGGTGCGPAGARRGKVRPLQDPAVGATAHARLSSGALNTVTEYDAKPAFGGTVYLMTNTTSVRVGGITRAIVRTGTPIVTVDRFRRCDPNSDGTLTWRYVAVQTANPARPWLYGWLPATCPARMRTR
ncbi:MAG: hypothetical protein PGN13_10725 [Patulibacter minatonensis]